MTHRKIILLAALLTITCVSSSLGKSGETDAAVTAKLVLATDKRVYTVGEPIKFRYSIQNIGNVNLYISPSIDDISFADAGVLIILHDRNGTVVRGQVIGEGGAHRKKDGSIVDRVRNTWLLLSPRSFYGKESQYFSACDPDPGEYKLLASYYNTDIARRSATELGSLSSLPFPVLTERLVAEADFEIRGKRSSKSCSDFHPLQP